MIGVLGGTFDPIHFGHLRPALDCVQSLGLSEVRLVPLGVAGHRAQPKAAARMRLAMVQAAVAGVPGLAVDGRELARDGVSYSYDTLVSLRREVGPGAPVCLLVGEDAFNGFLSWHRPADILALAHVVAMQRPGSPEPDDPALCEMLAERGCADPAELRSVPAGCILRQHVTQLAISSSRIRALIAAGRSPRYLLPDAVLAIIEREGLYLSPAGRGAITIF
jgi:nicotinate-nucleotide adenylyltransferase